MCKGVKENLWPIIKDDHVYHDYWYYNEPQNLDKITNMYVKNYFNRKELFEYLYNNKGIPLKFRTDEIDFLTNTLYIGEPLRVLRSFNEEYLLRNKV